MTGLKKIFKWLVILLIIFSIIIILAGIYVTYFYKDKVVGMVINELNNHLRTEVVVQNVDFTVFRHFPDASVVFYGVTVKGAPVSKKKIAAYNDTLLKAGVVALEFDIINLLKKKYVFKSIDINDGKLNLFIDGKGNVNTDILKPDTSGTANSQFEIKLSRIKLKRVQTYFENVSKAEILDGSVPELVVSGKLSSNSVDLALEGLVHVGKYSSHNVTYLKNKNIDVALGINGDTAGYSLKVGALKLEDVNLNLSGNIDLKDKTGLDLKVSSDNESVVRLLSLLPSSVRREIADYDIDGNMNFVAYIKGVVDYKTAPHIEGRFNIKNGKAVYKPASVSLKDINLSAVFSNGKNNNSETGIIEVDTFYASLGNSYLKASYKIKNFIAPRFYGKSYVHADIGELIEFLGLDTVEQAKGIIDGNVTVAGEKNRLNSLKDLSNLKAEGELVLNGAEIKFTGDERALLSHVDSRLRFNNRVLEVNELNGYVKGQKINIKGVLNNFADFVLSESNELNGVFTLRAPKLDLDVLLAGGAKDTSAQDKQISYRLKFDIDVDTVLYKGEKLRDFTAVGVIGKDKYFLPSFSVRYAGGTVDGSIGMKANTVTGKVNTADLNIRKVFMLFDDFGQDFISYKNLKGILTSSSDFSFAVDNTGKVDINTFKLTSDIVIKNGELINFEPLEKLSKFLSLSEVRHVYFTDIKNTIYIDRGRLVIPSMHIESSTLDFDIDGYHYFSGKFEYHVRLYLSELLSKKYRQNHKDTDNDFVVYDQSGDRTKIFLLIYGDGDNVNYKYDKQRVKKHIKERIKEEKNNLKNIIKEEFHWFTKDTAIKNKVKKDNDLKRRLKEKKKKEEEKKNELQFDFGG